ncbi:MAG: response regulator [Pedobacter sp.]|nr:MAG: response regulator [Pedobacter sp.]
MKKSIIIVETDQSILDVLIILLTEEGYHVKGTVKFQEVETLVNIEQPKLVILEFKLKGLDAIKLCEQFKREFPSMVILAISCNEDIETTSAISGFDGFIAKPFEIDVLARTIHLMLN